MGLRNLRKYLDEPGQPPGFVVFVPKICASLRHGSISRDSG